MRSLESSNTPVADQEPQIAFRADAGEWFDERLRYGYSNKSALLMRLGITGTWSSGKQTRAIVERSPPAVDAGRYRRAGWVTRLSSGNDDADSDANQRVKARYAALFKILCRLDERVILRSWRVGQPLLYRPDAMREETWASDALKAETDGQFLASGVNSLNPADPRVMRGIVVAALAAAATRERRFADACAARVRTSYLAPNAVGWRRIFPEATQPSHPSAILDASMLVPVLDGMMIAHSQGALTVSEMTSLTQLARELLDRLLIGPQSRALLTARNANGTWYEVLVLALAAFVGDVAAMRTVLERAPMRIAQQINPDGTQPEEEAQDDPLHHALLNMEGWTYLARMALPLSCDVWSMRSTDGRSLSRALRHLAKRTSVRTVNDPYRRRAAAIVQLSPLRSAPWSTQKRSHALEALDAASALPPYWPLLLEKSPG